MSIYPNGSSDGQARAFTLIELLVVIAIVAVMLAILLPVYAQSRAKSRSSQAISNLRQIGSALLAYVNDYDECLPARSLLPAWPGYDVIFISHDQRSLAGLLEPYVRNRQIWYSPEDRLPERGKSSFALNEQLAYAWPLSKISRPAEGIYLTDRTDLDTFEAGEVPNDSYTWWNFCRTPMPGGHADLPCDPDLTRVSVQISPRRYTGDVALYLFLDGHVQALPFARTWGDAAHNLHYALK